MCSRILVPVDLDKAEKPAKAHDAEEFYVDVIEAVPKVSTQTEVVRAVDRLEGFAAQQARTYGARRSSEITLRSDLNLNVGADIVKTANEADCDLIVMASHVPHIFSSNGGYVASYAPMSVYVVR